MRRFFIGVDGGATKTDAVLCDETGLVLSRAAGPSTNPQAVTFSVAFQNLRHVLLAVCERANISITDVYSLFAGLSGGGVGNNRLLFLDALHSFMPHCAFMDVHSDGVCALRNAIQEGNALAVILGTGSSVFVGVENSYHQIGGWGNFFGDEGSGYDLGSRAVRLALRQRDGRGGETLVTELCEQKLGQDVRMAIPELYRQGKAYVAQFSGILLTAAEKGDALAFSQAQEAARGIAECIQTGGKMFSDPVKRIAAEGSIWHSPFYRDLILRILGNSYRLETSSFPPVFGAASIAFRQSSSSAPDDLRQVFERSLPPANPV